MQSNNHHKSIMRGTAGACVSNAVPLDSTFRPTKLKEVIIVKCMTTISLTQQQDMSQARGTSVSSRSRTRPPTTGVRIQPHRAAKWSASQRKQKAPEQAEIQTKGTESVKSRPNTNTQTRSSMGLGSSSMAEPYRRRPHLQIHACSVGPSVTPVPVPDMWISPTLGGWPTSNPKDSSSPPGRRSGQLRKSLLPTQQFAAGHASTCNLSGS
jgi:hypothetical protein